MLQCYSSNDKHSNLSILKNNIKALVGSANYLRLGILNRAFQDIKRTFVGNPQSPSNPLTVETIRNTLEDMGVRKGDVIHLQSSLAHLMQGAQTQLTTSVMCPMNEYAIQIIDMLTDLVGKTGTISMNTESIRDLLLFVQKGSVFDYSKAPSIRGIISEIFRKYYSTARSVSPRFNVSAWGKYALELVNEHEKSAPYMMGLHSPWQKLNEFEAKVILLGETFEINSPIHMLEHTYFDEFPIPILTNKPLLVKYVGFDRGQHFIPIILHSPIWKKGAPEKFARYLDAKHHVYQIAEFNNQCRIVSYAAKKQFSSMVEEMKNGVTWYDVRFYP